MKFRPCVSRIGGMDLSQLEEKRIKMFEKRGRREVYRAGELTHRLNWSLLHLDVGESVLVHDKWGESGCRCNHPSKKKNPDVTKRVILCLSNPIIQFS